MTKLSLLTILLSTFTLFAQKKQILLIGTFHFENPSLDVAKVNTFNVMSPKSQNELQTITNKIKDFHPNKIFVEWPYNKQPKLDNFCQKNTDSLLQKDPDEIVQLALRTAQKLNNKKLYAIDYRDTSFPYDSLLKGMTEAGQSELLKRNEQEMKQFQKDQNQKRATLTLTNLLLDVNSSEANKFDLQWYIGMANKAGKPDNFVGAYLVAEWYKRNLYMYALIQKLTEQKDDKIMVLLGASHAAMLREFIKHDLNFELLEIKDLLK